MRGDLGLNLGGACEGAVPPRLEFCRHEPVPGIGGIILAKGAVGTISCRFEVPRQRFANLIAATGDLRPSLGGGSDCARLDHLQQRVLDGIADPQAAEGDAARFAIVEQSPPAGIARKVVLGASVADRQFAATAPAAHETGEQRIAVLGAPGCRLAGRLSLTIARITSTRSLLT